jgi:hypothetical protein
VTSLVALILGIMLLVPVPGLANFANPTDPLTGSQPTIRILTLNVMQNSPGVDRDVRFTGIANYLQTHQVHALALQEPQGAYSIHLLPMTAAPIWPPSWVVNMAITRNQRLAILTLARVTYSSRLGSCPAIPWNTTAPPN